MIYYLLALVVITLFCGIVMAIFGKLYKKYKLAYEQEHEKLLGIQEEYSKLVQAYEIKKKNKEKADEKISNLRNGVVSADDILPKR